MLCRARPLHRLFINPSGVYLKVRNTLLRAAQFEVRRHLVSRTQGERSCQAPRFLTASQSSVVACPH